MEKVNIDKYVIMIKDIIDQEEADFLIDMAKGATDEEWDAYRKSLGEEADSVNAAYGDWKKQMLWLELNPNLFERAKDLVESINKRCIYLINDHYQTDYILDPLYNIYKFREGDFMKEHHDSGLSPDIKLGVVLYLNDDFDGGTLRFKETQDRPEITITPKTGSFLVFHGGHKNLHEVTLVKKSSRYTIGGFWDDREESDYPQEVRDAWAEELAKVRAIQKDEAAEWEDYRKRGVRITPRGEQYPASEVEG